jgi:hypothetical protein
MPQTIDRNLKGVARLGRSVLPPDRVHQRIRVERLAAASQKNGESSADNPLYQFNFAVGSR